MKNKNFNIFKAITQDSIHYTAGINITSSSANKEKSRKFPIINFLFFFLEDMADNYAHTPLNWRHNPYPRVGSDL